MLQTSISSASPREIANVGLPFEKDPINKRQVSKQQALQPLQPLLGVSLNKLDLVDSTRAGLSTAHTQEKTELSLVLNLSGEPVTQKEADTIYVNDLESLRNYKAFLAEKCEVSVYPEQMLSSFASLDELIDMPLLKKDGLSDFANGVCLSLRSFPPYFDWLTRSHLALTSADALPPAISKTLVHKRKIENVLVSTPFKTGNLYWFNMFERSEEFRFDHESDHVQGVLLMEGLRQASIAAVHQEGLPVEGSLALLSFDIGFFSYVDHGYPVLIRVFPAFDAQRQGKEALALVISQIFQKGRLCAEAVVSGQAFFSAQEYAAVRERTMHIIDKQAKKFERALSCVDAVRA
ncbi:MAG: AfsA-related hotdog domain-containing protein [Pseudomonadota bacterium]